MWNAPWLRRVRVTLRNWVKIRDICRGNYPEAANKTLCL